MIRLVLFFALLLAAAFGFATLADLPGHVVITMGDTEYRLSLIVAGVGLLLVFFAAMAIWTAFRLLFRLPSLIGLASRMRRHARGQQAVARGLVAIGTGNQRLAQRAAEDAQKLLGDEPLVLLLKAQSAQLAGDTRNAETAFRAMLDREETASLGLRGLHIEAERRGDGAAARLFAQEALQRAPDAAWAREAMLAFRAGAGEWREAIAIVDQGVSRRQIDRAEGKATRALLLAAAAQDIAESNPDQAGELAAEALRSAPGLIAAAEIHARRLSAKGDFSKAARIIETAWKENPHPDLAEAYLNIRHGDSALDRLKRARTLARIAPDARESRFALARAALDAREFGAAREALDTLVLQKPTARACLLMAELEEVESSNQGLVRAWLARASRAPRDPAWVADGIVSNRWRAVSPVTGKIGAFEWKDPPQALETHLRARIDADRFGPLLDAAASADEETAMPEAPQAPVPVTRPEAKPEQPTEEAAFQPMIPDDPGPHPDKPRPKRGFRLFG